MSILQATAGRNCQAALPTLQVINPLSKILLDAHFLLLVSADDNILAIDQESRIIVHNQKAFTFIEEPKLSIESDWELV
jgi:hypothetical protein